MRRPRFPPATYVGPFSAHRDGDRIAPPDAVQSEGFPVGERARWSAQTQRQLNACSLGRGRVSLSVCFLSLVVGNGIRIQNMIFTSVSQSVCQSVGERERDRQTDRLCSVPNWVFSARATTAPKCNRVNAGRIDKDSISNTALRE